MSKEVNKKRLETMLTGTDDEKDQVMKEMDDERKQAVAKDKGWQSKIERIRAEVSKLTNPTARDRIMARIEEDLRLPELSEHSKITVSLHDYQTEDESPLSDGMLLLEFGASDWTFVTATGESIGEGMAIMEATT